MTARPSQLNDTSSKPVLRPGSPVCQCSMCNLFFAGPDVFDRHLLGFHDKCRTPEQMRAKGMLTNAHGVWMRGTAPKKEQD